MIIKPPTAAILIIGNEILSGRTQDVNIRFIAERLVARGIVLTEVRVVRDEERAIIDAVHTLSKACDMVFTTGGIGPTHDDITADCMAKAFGMPLEINAEAKEMMASYCQMRGVPLNEGRLRMARIPKGATLIKNKVSAAPGFQTKNVYVLAGVPNIMRDMFDTIEASLPQGETIYSHSVISDLREGDIALELEDIQHQFPNVDIGSYPSMIDGKPSLSLVMRGSDPKALGQALERVVDMVKSQGKKPEIERDTRIV